MTRLLRHLREDLRAIRERDPASRTTVEALLCMPGMHALWAHRLLHPTHRVGERWSRAGGLRAGVGEVLRVAARLGAHAVRVATGVEIHPGARIGRRVVIDHGLGVVIGETAEVGDDCTLYQGVTLGGTSHAPVKRHPTLGRGVLVGANAVVLGPVRIGDGARIGAAATVIHDVPAGETMVGRVARRRSPRAPTKEAWDEAAV